MGDGEEVGAGSRFRVPCTGQLTGSPAVLVSVYVFNYSLRCL